MTTIKARIDEQLNFADQVKPTYTVETLNGKVNVLEGIASTAEINILALQARENVQSMSSDYAAASDGAIDLLAAKATARRVQIVIQVLDVFANGNGVQPTFTIGDESNATRFVAAAELTNAAAGTKIVGAGIITAGEKLVLTATAGTGTATGAIRVVAMASS
jgi:hypothetical protein